MSTSALERWRETEKVLDAALDLPPTLRADFLAQRCGNDPALRARVERLLRACVASESFLGEPVAAGLAPLVSIAAEAADLPAPGDRVGAYRVIREAGRGGMGVVYLAERDDGAFHKRVALKLVLRARGSGDALARRFREERQILASLEHPGIARLLDGGALPDGRPYCVMEYVEGTPIDRYCDERGLDVASRLDLFGRVCDAVQHAHHNRIVHGDLKPSNILVTDDGAVKLLDFGIATLLLSPGEHIQPGEAPTVQHVGRVLTPDYASPEQLRGAALGVASDVYSLGIVLYKLLSGRHPGRGVATPQLDAAVTGPHVELRRPSTPTAREPGDGPGAEEQRSRVAARSASGRGTPPGNLAPRSSGELDDIVMTALREVPQERYHSAGEFARVVRRHLALQMPRGARRPRRARRTAILAQRRPAVAALVALVVVGLSVALPIRPWSPVRSRGAPPSAIAVFPFTPSVPDTLLQRLGRDLVLTVSASLHGVGGLRAVDAQAILGQTLGDRERGDIEAIARVGRRLGAGIVISGSLMRVGSRVRADGVVAGADGGRVLAHVSATGSPADLPALTDSLAWALVGQLPRLGAMRPLPQAVTTRSLPALRAYLDGDRLVDEYRMRAAADAFARAFAADSTFRFAAWRHAWAREFHALPVDSAIERAYLAHRGQFPAPDRLLLESRMIDDPGDRLASAETLVARFPDHWPGWFELGETRLRRAPFAGGSLSEAEQPFRRTVSLNRDFVPGWDRLFWLAIDRRDTVGSARALAELRRLRFDSTSRLDDRFDMLLLYRHLDGLARRDGVPNAPLADSLARAFVRSGYRPSANGMPDRLQGGIARYGFHRARADLAERQLRTGLGGPWFQWQVIGYSLAARGAWDSALVAADRAARGSGRPAAILHGYRLAVVGAWVGAIPSSVAVEGRRRGESVWAELRPEDRAELAWVDGLLATVRHDGPALAGARAALRKTRAPAVTLLDSSLGAFALDLSGDRRGALELLLALEEGRHRVDNNHPFRTGVDRLIASDWLSAAGRRSEADRILKWHEAMGDTGPHSLHANALLAPFALLARARILDAQGRRDDARAQYARFLGVYDAPVKSHRPLVEEARSVMTRLAPR